MRHLPSLQELYIHGNNFGWEGMAAVANSLTELETLSIQVNEEVRTGVVSVGRLPMLKQLYARTLLAFRRESRNGGVDYNRSCQTAEEAHTSVNR